MKKRYAICLLFLITRLSTAQVVLFSDSLTSGGGNWTLAQSSGPPAWIVNNVYNCSENTPNNGGGNYMHIYDGWFDDYCNVAGYAGLGSGTGGSLIYSTMKSTISTVGQSLVTIKFDWLCAGQTGSITPTYGTIDYSTNGGSSWTNIISPRSKYDGQSSWTTTTISSAQVPGLVNQASLKIRFGFISSGYGNNPAFGVDNIVISGDVATFIPASSQPAIDIYADQSGNMIYIRGASLIRSRVRILNILGEKITAGFQENKDGLAADISLLKPGAYIMQYAGENGVVAKRFVKK